MNAEDDKSFSGCILAFGFFICVLVIVAGVIVLITQ